MTLTAPPRHGPALPGDGAFFPARMMEIELTKPLPAICRDEQHQRAWVLARLHTEPAGACVLPLPAGGLTPDQVAATLWEHLREAVQDRYQAAGLPRPHALPATGLQTAPEEWPYLRRRAEVLSTAPFISVVVCTRDRADQLAACLHHLERQDYPGYEIVVVDNAPTTGAVRMIVEARAGGPVGCRYVAEPRGGLSWARNAGIAAAAGDIVAFLDDDEEPDRHWLAELARGFARSGDIGCVTGMILPARLDTPAQELFELAGGHSNGRGFHAAVFSPDGPQSPLFPLPPFGAGGNMAFRRETLARIGGFDVAMGAGTPARGGEDSLALTLALLAGRSIAYEPGAFVRHTHYRDLDSLARQWHGYGVGLTAYYAALLRHRPAVFPALLRLLPAAARYLRTGQNGQSAPYRLPPGIQRQQRRGMLTGPAAYVRSVRRQAQVAAAAKAPGART